MSTAALQTVGAIAPAAETAAEDCTLTTLDDARRAFDRDYLDCLLKITEGNVTRASRLAGRNRTEFYRLLERHSLVPSSFKPSPRDGG